VQAQTGNTTTGSNSVTGLTVLRNFAIPTPGTRAITDIPVGAFFIDGFGSTGLPFPPGTQVTSIDAANNTVFMSANATANITFTTGSGAGRFVTGAYDSDTGQTLGFISDADRNSGNAQTIAQNFAYPFATYGYPATGFTPSNFDVYTLDDANSYALTRDISNFFQARTQLEAPRTVFNIPRGLVVGNGDLTNRAENDPVPSFGINVLWDGLANVTQDFAGQTPVTQLLMKQYSDNSLAGTGQAYGTGPRIFFTTGQGNKNQSYRDTYPRINTELGRITWWSPTQDFPVQGTLAPPAYISVMTNRDMTGSQNGGVGMYLSASPNNNIARRGLFVSHELGNTLIASSNATSTGPSLPITFAPMWTSAAASATGAANASYMFNSTMAATNYQWANVNYDNPTGYQGSRLSITNGVSTVSARNGNLVLALDRNDNGAGFGSKEWAFKLRSGQTDLVLTEDDVIRTTFAGANITTAGNITASTFLGNLSGTTAALSGNADITGNVNLGTNATINYDAVYGCFHNMANVTAANADTVYEFVWPNVHINTNRVTVAGNSQITIGQEGAYVFNLEMQAENTDNQDRTAFIWLAKNGTDIEETCVRVSLLKEWKQVIVKEWIVNSLNANDYIEVRFAVDNASGIQLTSIPAQASPYARPAVPSAVITVTPVGA
jgi:hypothetical protein